MTSPTFNIMNEYTMGSFAIKHYDLYRVKSDNELKDLDLFEIIIMIFYLLNGLRIIKQNLIQ